MEHFESLGHGQIGAQNGGPWGKVDPRLIPSEGLLRTELAAQAGCEQTKNSVRDARVPGAFWKPQGNQSNPVSASYGSKITKKKTNQDRNTMSWPILSRCVFLFLVVAIFFGLRHQAHIVPTAVGLARFHF